MQKRQWQFGVLGALAVGVLAFAYASGWFRGVPSEADLAAAALGSCLTEKGVVMYGAYWCPHCENQKEMFGKGWEKVKYVECAEPGKPKAQTQECKDAGIEGYPTWVFPDGERLSGERPLSELAEKAGCQYGVSQ